MEEITLFLSNPIVALLGYALTIASGLIALQQFISARRAHSKLLILNIELNTLRLENSKLKISNRNHVEQGDRSQYFQQNSGPIKIDNRG